MDVFALTMRLKEEGAAQVEAAMDKMRRSMDQAGTEAKQLDGAFGQLKTAMKGLIAGASVGLVINKIVEETSAAQFAQAQLAAALQSTGGAAGQSADALTEHASALQKVTVFGDDAIIAAQSLLLTFTKIQGDTFPKATEAVLNVAQAMGTDLKSAAIQVGKALNDPVLGVSALARSGIQFTQSQKDMIASLVETNRTVEAQAIILKELETQFGGSAAAARNTLGGALKGLQNDFGDLFEMSGDGSQGIVNAINAISGSLGIFSGMLNDVVQFASWAFVGLVKAVNNLYIAIKRMVVQTANMFVGLFTPLENLPFVGKQIGDVLGAIRAGLRNVDADLADQQKSWEEWEQRQYRNIFVAEKVKKAVGGGGGGGSVGGIGGPRRETPAEVARRIAGMAPAGGTAFKEGFKVAAIDSAVLAREKVAKVRAMMSEEQARFLADMENFAIELDRQVTATFADAFASGIEQAISSGKIKEGFKTLLSTMLNGLGNILIQLGTALLPVSKLIAKLWSSLATLNPIAMTAAAIGLIAIGGAMKGIAGRVVGGGGGGGGDRSISAPVGSAMGGAMTLAGLTYGPTAAGSAATIQQIPAMNVTIIGPNDPSAQRQMQELMRNAKRRGEA